MIIILEGLNGVGKTTVGLELSKHLDIPFHRPFRLEGVKNGFYPDMGKMRSLGVPANCYHEEIYISDFLRGVKCDVVLDRSMPSAIVYGRLHKDIPSDETDVDYLRSIWVQNMIKAKALMVYFRCDDYDVVKNRCPDRMPFDSDSYAQALQHMDSEIGSCILPRIIVDAKILTADEIKTAILGNMLKL